MNTKVSVLLATLLAAAAPLAGAANVATGATVSTTGSGFGLTAGWSGADLADPSSLVDDHFLGNGHQWNNGSVFWQGGRPDAADTITITLAGAATVTGLTLEGDNNDVYTVSYEDTGGAWHWLVDLNPANPPTSWGMGVVSTSFSAITAIAFDLQATNGDNSYAVSEFQATGAFLPAVPEPTAGLMLLAGLGALGAVARRRAAR